MNFWQARHVRAQSRRAEAEVSRTREFRMHTSIYTHTHKGRGRQQSIGIQRPRYLQIQWQNGASSRGGPRARALNYRPGECGKVENINRNHGENRCRESDFESRVQRKGSKSLGRNLGQLERHSCCCSQNFTQPYGTSAALPIYIYRCVLITHIYLYTHRARRSKGRVDIYIQQTAVHLSRRCRRRVARRNGSV